LIAQKNGIEESDMDFPKVKDYKPRKQLGDEVIEQEVYDIDPYTHNLLLDSMPEESDWHLLDKHVFIEDMLVRTLNKQVRAFTRHCHPDDNYVAYRKGLGVVCNKEAGFSEDDFVVEFLGELYPAWRWFEKQDGVRALQKDCKEPAPEFNNIYLERPRGMVMVIFYRGVTSYITYPSRIPANKAGATAGVDISFTMFQNQSKRYIEESYQGECDLMKIYSSKRKRVSYQIQRGENNDDHGKISDKIDLTKERWETEEDALKEFAKDYQLCWNVVCALHKEDA
ncbi:hypothetical protein Tco_0695105, partial [Tanacetum coccineum]